MVKKVVDIYPPCKKRKEVGIKKKKEKGASEKKRGLFVFPLIAIILIFGYFYYSSYKTSIVIYPKVESFELERSLLARSTGSLGENDIRGRVISERFSDTREFEIEGVKMVEEKAEGEIRVCQTYRDAPVTYVEGTRFISDEGKYFTADRGFTLPGRGTNNGCATVKVTAMEAGEDHNVSEDSSFSLPGLVGQPSYPHVNGTSFRLTKEGVKEEVPDLDEETRKRAESQMKEDILEKGIEMLKEEYGEDYFFESETQFSVDVAQRGFQELEDKDGVFIYELDVVIRVITISREDVMEFLASVIPENSTWRKEMQEMNMDFLRLNFEDGEAEISFSFVTDIYQDVDKEGLKRSLAGLSFADAREIIVANENIENVVISNFPFGLSRVASDHNRIDVRLEFDKN